MNAAATTDEIRARLARWSLPLTLLAVIAVFLPGVQAGFVFDDQVLVAQNRLTGSLENVPEMFRVSLWDTVEGPGNLTRGYYRPMFLVSLALDRAAGGLDPRLAHLHSLGWHLLCVILLDRLLRRLIPDPLAVAAGVALFALHPVQVEAVQWIAARNDPMAAAGVLGGLLLLTGERAGAARLLGGALALLFAMLCKESAALSPVLVGILCWAQGRRAGPGVGAAAGALALYLGVRAGAGVGWPEGAELGRLGNYFVYSMALYADRLLVPVSLAPITHLAWPPPLPWWSPLLLGAPLLALARLGGRSGVAGLAVAGLCFGPSLGGLAVSGLLADRYLYLPLAGLSLTVAAGLAGRRAALPTLAVALLGGTALSAWQLPAWRDEEALWTTTLALQPSPYAAGAYAKHLELTGRLDEAARWNHEATLPPKPYSGACYNVASLHLRRGDPETAAREGLRALEAGCRPSAELLAPLSLALALSGDWAEAERQVSRIEGEDPTGKAVIVRVALAARRGDLGPFEAASARADVGTRAAMAAQIAGVLERGGEEEAARALLELHGARGR